MKTLQDHGQITEYLDNIIIFFYFIQNLDNWWPDNRGPTT